MIRRMDSERRTNAWSIHHRDYLLEMENILQGRIIRRGIYGASNYLAGVMIMAVIMEFKLTVALDDPTQDSEHVGLTRRINDVSSKV